jgi:hypothetical protein
VVEGRLSHSWWLMTILLGIFNWKLVLIGGECGDAILSEKNGSGRILGEYLEDDACFCSL